MAALNNAFPLTDILALPYVFDSTDHMRRALDGAPGREILKAFEARGLVGLAFYDSGTRCFYNHVRPVVEPADLKGLKIRVPPSDIFVGLVRALGANPTPLSYGEVFSALQTRSHRRGREQLDNVLHEPPVRGGAPLGDVRASRIRRSAADVEEAAGFHVRLRPRLDSFDIAAQSVPYMRQLWDRREAESRAAVEMDGVRVTNVDRKAFQQAAAPLLAEYLKESDLDRLYRQIRALA